MEIEWYKEEDMGGILEFESLNSYTLLVCLPLGYWNWVYIKFKHIHEIGKRDKL